MSKRYAIYEPEPRLCGPGTWAANVREGFRRLGHMCDVVTFTRSGKPSAKWGRPIGAETTLGQQCPLSVDVVNPVLDDYDGVILTDVRCAPQEKAAYDAVDLPEYVYRLSTTSTKWCSALHGRWYWAEHECPSDKRPTQGSPFIEELLELPNFAGQLLCHAHAQDEYCEVLRKTPKVGPLPLPYVPKCAIPLNAGARTRTIGTIGRVIPTKYRHLISQAAIEGHLRDMKIIYAGSISGAQGPVESFLLWEQLTDGGFVTVGERRGGVKTPSKWQCTLTDAGVSVHFRGAYDSPVDVLHDVNAHVGIADCDFSHGLLEFATLEAVDCGCAPIVSQAYMPHATSCPHVVCWPHSVTGMGKAKVRGKTDLFVSLAACVEQALAMTDAQRQDNVNALFQYHNPTIHAEALCRILAGSS